MNGAEWGRTLARGLPLTLVGLAVLGIGTCGYEIFRSGVYRTQSPQEVPHWLPKAARDIRYYRAPPFSPVLAWDSSISEETWRDYLRDLNRRRSFALSEVEQTAAVWIVRAEESTNATVTVRRQGDFLLCTWQEIDQSERHVYDREAGRAYTWQTTR